MPAKVTYIIGRSGRRYYDFELPRGEGGTLEQEDFEAIRDAFNNPILKYDFTKRD